MEDFLQWFVIHFILNLFFWDIKFVIIFFLKYNKYFYFFLIFILEIIIKFKNEIITKKIGF